MNFEATVMTQEIEAALNSIQDQSAGANGARAAIRSIIESGALGEKRLVHVHASTSERSVAVLVRIVERPEDAR